MLTVAITLWEAFLWYAARLCKLGWQMHGSQSTEGLRNLRVHMICLRW